MRVKLEKIFFNAKDIKEKETSVYALLDASGSDEVYNKAMFYDTRFTALFDEKELETVSPYLVKLEKDDEATEWVLNNYTDVNWMSFIQSSKPYSELLQTLKAFTKTYDEKEEHYVYIRYYDPRAIEITLDMFGEDGRKEWFETIDAMYARDTLEKDILLKFTQKGKESLTLKEKAVV
jgi:hypothetical protein